MEIALGYYLIRKKSLLSALTLFFCFIGQLSVAEILEIKTCQISFGTRGAPVSVNIEGKSNKGCSGKLVIEGEKVKSGEITMELSELDTGIPLRNKHLRENYLHIEKFPTAVIKLTEIKDLEKQRKGGNKTSSAFSGTLIMHGVEAPLTKTEYIFKDPKKVTAKFSINLVDHGVPYPSFMGVKVIDVVMVTVDIEI